MNGNTVVRLNESPEELLSGASVSGLPGSCDYAQDDGNCVESSSSCVNPSSSCAKSQDPESIGTASQ